MTAMELDVQLQLIGESTGARRGKFISFGRARSMDNENEEGRRKEG